MDTAEFKQSFHRLDKQVEVTRYGRVIGIYTPTGSEVYEEATVEEVKKAIEPERVKTPERGMPTKGLGEDAPQVRQPPAKEMQDAWSRSKPVPKK